MVNTINIFSEALASLYNSSCDIFYFLSDTNPKTNITSQSLQPVYQNIPCRVSYTNLYSSTKKNDFSYVNSSPIKLFIQRDLTINPYSIFYITSDSKTLIYKASSNPSIYSSHQEIFLAPFEDFSI